MGSPFYFQFGEGRSAWAAPNPAAAGPMAQAEAYGYLVAVCPDTKTAVAKLREIRRAYKNRNRAGTAGSVTR